MNFDNEQWIKNHFYHFQLQEICRLKEHLWNVLIEYEWTDIPEYKRYKTHSHNSNVKKIEPTPTKTSRMKQESISNYFEKALDGENCGEEVVEIV